MSLPTFPTISPPMTPDESLSMILASIAMEELGLSHIISAEGEKIQYILGKLGGGPEDPPSFEEILAVNKSVKCVLDSIAQNQIILKGKMECAVDALEGAGLAGLRGRVLVAPLAVDQHAHQAASPRASAAAWRIAAMLVR